MSTINNQDGIGGMLSNKVRLREVSNRVELVKRRKRKDGPLSPLQEAAKEKFQDAVYYAKRQIADEETKALYAKGITDKRRSAYVVAMSDYLTSPKVSLVEPIIYDGSVGSTITVRATDDFMVTKVRVAIHDAAGALIEEGEAGPDSEKRNLWEYKTKVANPSVTGCKIQAFAFDRPGNAGTVTKVL